MGDKLGGWLELRVAEHQLGIANTVDYFARTNTPFPWKRKNIPPKKSPAYVVAVDGTRLTIQSG